MLAFRASYGCPCCYNISACLCRGCRRGAGLGLGGGGGENRLWSRGTSSPSNFGPDGRKAFSAWASTWTCCSSQGEEGNTGERGVRWRRYVPRDYSSWVHATHVRINEGSAWYVGRRERASEARPAGYVLVAFVGHETIAQPLPVLLYLVWCYIVLQSVYLT